MTDTIFPELACYLLPGHVSSPVGIYEEIRAAEALGLGSVWISERLNSKDIGVLTGAAAARTDRMGIVAGLIANLTIRHPLVVAGYGATMAKLSGERFALGFGRGVERLSTMTGTPRITFSVLEDYLDLLRRLWRGEVVSYDGPVGKLERVSLGAELAEPPPVIMAAMGEKTCRWAGRHCDGVVLNSLWTPEAVAASVRQIREGAEAAGRDPASVRVWSIQVTACEQSEEIMLNTVVRRMNTYLLTPMFEGVCQANRWDMAVAQKIRGVLAEMDARSKPGMFGTEHTTRELDDLRRIRDLYPQQWLYEGNAVGDAEQCARSTLARIDAGADGILFHGTEPAGLQPLLARWPALRPASRFAGRSVNPGR